MTGMINDGTLNCLCIYLWENLEGMYFNNMSVQLKPVRFSSYDKPDGSLCRENTVFVVLFLCQT